MKFIPQEYKDEWDTFDKNNQQQFLDYLKERNKNHKKNANSDEIVRRILREVDNPSNGEAIVCHEFDITKEDFPF